MDAPLLVVDAGSPLSSVALGDAADVAVRTFALQETSAKLLPAIAELLAEAGLGLDDLAGLVALAGPGSFTGLRIGLATVLGLHQASGRPATALPTDLALAAAAAEADPDDRRDVVAVVDALRGEWTATRFVGGDPARPLGAPRLTSAAEVLAGGSARVVGFGVGGWCDEVARLAGTTLLEPPALAPPLVRYLARRAARWDAAALSAPLYARPPAAAPPGRPKVVVPLR